MQHSNLRGTQMHWVLLELHQVLLHLLVKLGLILFFFPLLYLLKVVGNIVWNVRAVIVLVPKTLSKKKEIQSLGDFIKPILKHLLVFLALYTIYRLWYTRWDCHGGSREKALGRIRTGSLQGYRLSSHYQQHLSHCSSIYSCTANPCLYATARKASNILALPLHFTHK